MGDTVLVLVLNAGSSSLKFNLFDMGKETSVAEGMVERVGLSEASLACTIEGEKHKELLPAPTHKEALEAILEQLQGTVLKDTPIHAVGHRVVHGGPKYGDSVLVTEEVVRDIEHFAMYAPLHNPANALGIRTAMAAFPDVPHVAVFDTAFHHNIPDHARTYGIPYELSQKYGIRRYGFHGSSHRYVTRRTAEMLGISPDEVNVIVCHLGNGASITAVQNGKSVDTSMGLTPLEGLVMGTRSGDIDPSIIFHLAREANLNIAELDALLNRRSGMVGLTGNSDMREVWAQIEAGDADARIGMDVYTYRLRKYIASYFGVVPNVHAVVFTAGVGENDHGVRAETIRPLAHLGLTIDDAANVNRAAGDRIIDDGTGRTRVMVIATNEELEIARETLDVLG